MKNLNSLLTQFETARLPKSDWTHETHLRVALGMLHRYPFEDALCRLRAGIISLNNFHQTINSGNSGYHETLTVFWATVVGLYLFNSRHMEFKSLANEFLSNGLSSRDLPYYFYEKEVLMSSRNRAIFVPPTICSLTWENLLKLHKRSENAPFP